MANRYEIERELGRGGMATVYLARDLRHQRSVALKVLRPEVSGALGSERFAREIAIAARLSHPHILPIHDSGTLEVAAGAPGLFYTMPFVAGKSVRDRLDAEPQLPLEEAVRIARQVAEALEHAHRLGIIHRDIKPENILLAEGEAVVADFGIARALDAAGGERLTETGLALGTPAYMSPEQGAGSTRLDGRTDIYALGCVLYEMLAGQPPFTGPTAQAILARHAVDPVPSLRTVRSTVGQGLSRVVNRALAKVPADRYPTARAFAEALADPATTASHETVTTLTPVRVATGRRREVVGAGVVLVLALAVALVVVTRSNDSPPVTTATPAAATLAVLPFDEPGNGDDSHYVAVGLTDAISTDLARLGGIVVPSYPTTSRYRASAKPLTQIATELQVGTILRGRARRVGERVQVDAQLFNVKGEKQLWAQRYDRPLSEVLEIQRDLTRATLAALGVRLTSAERALLDRPPTTRARAYDAYLRGRAAELGGLPRELWTPMPTENVRRAQSLYSQARDLDPEFAAARARLGLMHTYSAAMYDTTDARREQARLEAETALRLQPGLPEAHEALANYWDRKHDVAKAVEQFKLALEGFPNSADLHMSLGSSYAQAGRLDEAVAQFEHAMQLEPGSPNTAFLAAVFYSRLRRDEEAMRGFDRALALAPDYHMVKVIKGHRYLRWKGTPDTLAAAMRGIPAAWDPDGMATYARYTALRVQRRYADALGMLDESRSELSRDGLVYQPASLLRAQLHDALGERAPARANYAAARALLRDSVNARPNDASIRVALGLAYAGLGQPSEAVREARRAMELVRVPENTPGATAFMGGAAEVFAKAGELDAAFELLELLFSMPAGREVTVAFLRVWPGFDPLRRDPRFEEVLERFATR